MTPVEALEGAIGNGIAIRFNRHLWKRYAAPGSVVAALPAERRDALGALRAGDIASVRQDVVGLYIEPDDGTRDLKRRFDRTLRSVYPPT